MNIKAIHQFLPVLAEHDAVGNDARHLRNAFREAGFDSEIFVEHAHHGVRKEAKQLSDYEQFSKRGSTGLLYHASTVTKRFGELQNWPDPLGIVWHNVTPDIYFRWWLPGATEAMVTARKQIRELSRSVDFAISDSTYSAEELNEAGYKNIHVEPILIDFSTYDEKPKFSRKSTEGTQWIFVGRVAPNKSQHDIINAFAVYRSAFDTKAHLTLVGGFTSDLYKKALYRHIAQLGLNSAVTITGEVPLPRLLGYYKRADVLVCLSEHEGFCVPIVEVMYLGVPVVAHKSTAVTATVGNAGVLLEQKSPELVASAVNELMIDTALREAIVERGRRRIDEVFSYEKVKKEKVDVIVEQFEKALAGGK